MVILVANLISSIFTSLFTAEEQEIAVRIFIIGGTALGTTILSIIALFVYDVLTQPKHVFDEYFKRLNRKDLVALKNFANKYGYSNEIVKNLIEIKHYKVMKLIVKNLGETIDLKDIIRFENLVVLSVRDNGFINCRKFRKLKSLEVLNLKNITINSKTLKNLTKISSVRKLSIKNCSIPLDFFEIIKNLKNLKELIVRDSELSSLIELSQLKKLVFLDLEGNLISDISEVSKLSNLEHLNLCKNKIEYISSLKSLTNLKYLDLDENNIRNLNGILENPEINELHFRYNYVTDIKGIANLKKLDIIDLGSNPIKEIEELKHLDLSEIRVSVMKDAFPELDIRQIANKWENDLMEGKLKLNDSETSYIPMSQMEKPREIQIHLTTTIL